MCERVVGYDRAEVLEQAQRIGAIDAGQADLSRACGGSGVIVLALPVAAIIDSLARVAEVMSETSLVTDVGSTKREICAAAERVWGAEAGNRFLPGHPMAGKAAGGVEHADAGLFVNAPWIFTPLQEPSGPAAGFIAGVQAIGAHPVRCSAEEHDRVCAYVSHLPQMMAIGLANVVDEMTEAGLEPNRFAGAGLRSMTRLAASPYAMWRDIALTNADNLADALLQMEQKLAHIRENLKSPELRAEFEKAQAACTMLK